MTPPIADRSRRRWLRGAAALPALGLLGACATSSVTYLPGPQGPVVLPSPKVGQRWRYQLVNRYSGQSMGLRVVTVTAVEGDQSVLSVTDGNGAFIGQERYQTPWLAIDIVDFDLPMRFAQPTPRLPTVLRAGLRDSFSTTYQVPNNSSSLPWSQWTNAPGWERIRVPAGEFECLRVERQIRFRHNDLFRDFPERTETLWYAPAVERWVQREWTGIYFWPGLPPTRLREDWVQWRLVDYTSAPTA